MPSIQRGQDRALLRHRGLHQEACGRVPHQWARGGAVEGILGLLAASLRQRHEQFHLHRSRSHVYALRLGVSASSGELPNKGVDK